MNAHWQARQAGPGMLRLAPQTTIGQRMACSGTGLHSGKPVKMSLIPAPVETGIVFRRVDLPGNPLIPARYDRTSELVLCTGVANDEGVKVGTVEHLLAALAGLGVDNLVVELDGPEVPVMDGSAAPFVFLLECATVVVQDAPRRRIRILEPVEVRDGDKLARLEPGEGFSVAVEIDFASSAIGNQRVAVELDEGSFKQELARARTFGFEHEVEQLRAMGLALGGSLENAVVVSGDRILNAEGLRFADEFVRHKALDAVGDLYLAGAPIAGRFVGVRTGHALNNRLLRELFARPSAWTWELAPALLAEPLMEAAE